MHPKVSVLMPNYNCEKYITGAIESILSQSFLDFEFIILDDASTDRSWEIIEKHAKNDSRIIARKNENNLGISGNRNKLLSLATGEFILWQDSDDISYPKRIEKQYRYMQKNPQVGAAGGTLQFFNSYSEGSRRCYKQLDSEIRKTIFRYSPLALPGSIMRRSVVEEVGGFTSGLDVAEDLDLSFRIGRKYKFGNIGDIVLKYRESDNSATFRNLKKMELATLKIRSQNAATQYYTMTLGDKIYNVLQHISIYLVPTKLKIWLFNLIRNS